MNHAQKVNQLAGMSYLLFFMSLTASGSVGQDTIAMHNLGHGSLYFEYEHLVIHVDPYSSQADYNTLPDADLIFITHGHSDHYDLTALNKIKTDSSIMIYTQAVKNLGTYSDTAIIMKNGDSLVEAQFLFFGQTGDFCSISPSGGKLDLHFQRNA